MRTEDEVSEFWSNIEKEYNAKIRFKTYAILLGKSSDALVNISGLLYILNQKGVFENFEKSPGLFQLFARRQKFEKFKIEFSVEDVLDVKEVSNRTAHRCIFGSIKESETGPIKPYQTFLSKSICQVRMRSDYSLFFDLLDARSFISYLNSHR